MARKMTKKQTRKKTKLKSKRAKEKYPALKPEFNLKTRFELIDHDYIDKLSPKEKDWLNRFNEEWVNANFKHAGKRIMTSKDDERASYSRNNARNRCIWTKAKASGSSVQVEDLKDYQVYHGHGMSEEDKLIEMIDQAKKRGDGSSYDPDHDEEL